MISGFILILSLLWFSLEAKAADFEVISFERGGISDSTGIVPPKKIQLEFGAWDYARDFDTSKRFVHKLGTSLWRYGLIEDRLEFRVANSGLNINSSEVGFDSLDLGYKLALIQAQQAEKAWYIPEVNLINHFSIPLSDTHFFNSGFNHFYKFLIAKPIGDKWSALINLGPRFRSGRTISSDDGQLAELPYVFNLGYQINQRWQIFTEIFGSWVFSSRAEDILGATVGTTYALKENLIWDFNTFWGLNSNTEGFGISTGLVYRF